MSSFYLEKEFYDYADDIEGVNIHYAWTPLGDTPDWDAQRVTRFMPLLRSPAQLLGTEPVSMPPPLASDSDPPRLRKKVLKLPTEIPDAEDGSVTNRYLLHHYFEIFQDGYRHYSPLFTEEIVAGAVESPTPWQSETEGDSPQASSPSQTIEPSASASAEEELEVVVDHTPSPHDIPEVQELDASHPNGSTLQSDEDLIPPPTPLTASE